MPVPLMFAVPIPPLFFPRATLPVMDMVAPPSRVRLPVPLWPTFRNELPAHEEPAPLTRAEEVLVELFAMKFSKLASLPPPVMLSVPLPPKPT